MQRRKTGKISIFSSLDVIFDFLMSRVKNLNRVSTWSQYQAESECWNQVFESSQKIDIEYSSQVRRLILKLDLTISLLNELKKKLLIVYHDFLNVFDREKTTQLSLHWSYDHKIKLKDENQSFKSWLYLMLSHKLQKIKKYLEENLKKKFITLSKALFASSILFVEKKDDNLRFCINYWKLNALIKRNRYSIFLIDEVLAQIQDSKYLTQLNIITAFNKLQMSSESENLTTLITFFNIYKYKVMLFELINESAFFQHYINNVLFKCSHKFCQTYLNDILIYSKILKKHRTHVKEVLNKLREVDLQINIDKCEFKIQKISFLELLIFINDLRMNSREVDVIWS